MPQAIDHPALANARDPAAMEVTNGAPTMQPTQLKRWASARPVATTPWRLWRALIALAYLAAAGFNASYTLPRSAELDVYADGAWFGFLGSFMREVFIPNGEAFVALVIVFEIVVAILIAGRGSAVDIGIVASVLWVLAVLPFLAWPYLITNLVLGIVQGLVARRSYDTPLWRTTWHDSSTR